MNIFKNHGYHIDMQPIDMHPTLTEALAAYINPGAIETPLTRRPRLPVRLNRAEVGMTLRHLSPGQEWLFRVKYAAQPEYLPALRRCLLEWIDYLDRTEHWRLPAPLRLPLVRTVLAEALASDICPACNGTCVLPSAAGVLPCRRCHGSGLQRWDQHERARRLKLPVQRYLREIHRPYRRLLDILWAWEHTLEYRFRRALIG